MQDEAFRTAVLDRLDVIKHALLAMIAVGCVIVACLATPIVAVVAGVLAVSFAGNALGGLMRLWWKQGQGQRAKAVVADKR